MSKTETNAERLERFKMEWEGEGDELCGYDIDWLIEQAERVQELEKERSKWKGQYTILKSKHENLKGRHRGACRHVEVVENDRNAKAIVLERFREEIKQLREALEGGK